MDITLSKTMEKEVRGVRVFGYRSQKDFVEDAIRRRLLTLRQRLFSQKVSTVRSAMRRRGIGEEEVLRDFDTFRRE